MNGSETAAIEPSAVFVRWVVEELILRMSALEAEESKYAPPPLSFSYSPALGAPSETTNLKVAGVSREVYETKVEVDNTVAPLGWRQLHAALSTFDAVYELRQYGFGTGVFFPFRSSKFTARAVTAAGPEQLNTPVVVVVTVEVVAGTDRYEEQKEVAAAC